MNESELHVYDFDQTLYDSKPSPTGNPIWYFHAKSLDGWGPPGYDPRWLLGVLVEARRSANSPFCIPIVVTARPDHTGMRSIIRQMLGTTQIPWRALHLKPIVVPQTDAAYKARVIEGYLNENPAIRQVVMWDDLPENLALAQVATELAGKRFVGVLTRP